MAEVSADDIVLGYEGADPHIVFMGSTVYDAGGNNNGRLDPGETADLTSTLLNIGGAGLSNLSTTIECSDGYINIIDNSGYFGSLPVDSIKENTADPYEVSVVSSTPHGHVTDFTLIATADGGFVDTNYFSVCIGQAVPTDSGYYYAYYSGGPHPQSPVFDWFAIDTTQTANPGVSLDLADNQTVTVNLPFTFTFYGVNYTQVSVNSNGWIAMGSQTDADWTNSSIPNNDGPQAMIAGLWDDLDPGNAGEPSDIYHYYDTANHRFVVEYFMVEHFASGYYETFEIILYDPAYYSTPTGDGEIYVQYLVEMQQMDNTLGIENHDESVGIEYFYNSVYNELAVPVTNQSALRYTTWPPDQYPGVEEDFEYTSIVSKPTLTIYPSIAKGNVSIYYAIPNHQTAAAIKIYDAAGRLVRSFEDLSNHESTIHWNRTDNSGKQVCTGIYFVNLETESRAETGKVIVVE